MSTALRGGGPAAPHERLASDSVPLCEPAGRCCRRDCDPGAQLIGSRSRIVSVACRGDVRSLVCARNEWSGLAPAISRSRFHRGPDSGPDQEVGGRTRGVKRPRARQRSAGHAEGVESDEPGNGQRAEDRGARKTDATGRGRGARDRSDARRDRAFISIRSNRIGANEWRRLHPGASARTQAR